MAQRLAHLPADLANIYNLCMQVTDELNALEEEIIEQEEIVEQESQSLSSKVLPQIAPIQRELFEITQYNVSCCRFRLAI